MHAGNAATHENAASDRPKQAHSLAADNKQSDSRRKNGGGQRKQYRRPIVFHVNRQVKGEHPHVVHRPDSTSHGDGATAQPENAGCAPRRRYPSSEVESRIGSDHRNEDGQGNQAVVIRADQCQISCIHDSSLC
jgi:hypothetical protein